MAYKGWIEPHEGTVIHGWAVTEEGRACTVTATLDGRSVSTRSALPRPDLVACGISQGEGGFRLDLSPLLTAGDAAVAVTFDDGTPVPGAPVTPATAPAPDAGPAEAPPPPPVAGPRAVPRASPPQISPPAPARRPTMAELDDLSLTDLNDALATGAIRIDPPVVPPMPTPAAPAPPPPSTTPARRGWLSGLLGRRPGRISR